MTRNTDNADQIEKSKRMKFVGNTSAETRALRIIGTSDLHGKFLPWDYGLNAESTSGSVAQLSTAIARFRDDNTLLVDAGDLIQFNSANIFVGGEDVHPMVQAINALRIMLEQHSSI